MKRFGIGLIAVVILGGAIQADAAIETLAQNTTVASPSTLYTGDNSYSGDPVQFVAENFTLAAAASLTSISHDGFLRKYSASTVDNQASAPFPQPASIDWKILADNGSVEYSGTGAAYTLTTLGNFGNDEFGETTETHILYRYTIDLASLVTSIDLAAGDYWVAFHNNLAAFPWGENENFPSWAEASAGDSLGDDSVTIEDNGTLTHLGMNLAFRVEGELAPPPEPETVPEPATFAIWSLLGLFGVIAGFARRKRAA